jgi:hypothetical protein
LGKEQELVMRHRDGILATVGVALCAAALMGIITTDVYSRAAGAEARGYQALVRQMEGSDDGAGNRARYCVNFAAPAPRAVAR